MYIEQYHTIMSMVHLIIFYLAFYEFYFISYLLLITPRHVPLQRRADWNWYSSNRISQIPSAIDGKL